MRFRWEFAAGAALLGLAAILALTDAGKGSLGTGWAEPVAEPVADLPEPPPFGAPTMTPAALAASLMAGDPGLTVVDIRPGDESPADRIPGSYWLPLDDPSWDPPGPFGEHRRLIIVTDSGLGEAGYWSLFAGMGHHDNFTVLAGGIDAWNERFADPQEPNEGADAVAWDDYEARRSVSLFLAGGVAALTDGAAEGGSRTAAPPPPPLPVRQASAAPKAAEGC